MSTQTSSHANYNPSNSDSFGLGTANFAAAVGVEQAVQTVDEATKVLDCECELQKNFASQMGGIAEGNTDGSASGSAPQGIIALEFNREVKSAQFAETALQDSARGSFDAAIAGAAGLVGSVTAGFKAYKDDDLDEDKANAEDLLNQLNDPKETVLDKISNRVKGGLKYLKKNLKCLNCQNDDSDETQSQNFDNKSVSNSEQVANLERKDSACSRDQHEIENSAPLHDPDEEAQANALATKWERTPEDGEKAHFTSYNRKVEKGSKDEKIQNRAIKIVKDDTEKKEIVKSNLRNHIRERGIQSKQMKSQNWQNYTQMTSMASQSGQGAATALGEQKQARATLKQQEADAEANLYKSAEQTVDAQFSKAAQSASEDQQQIASTLQNIAFPA